MTSDVPGGGVPTYPPPRDCPVCSSRLNVTELGCPNCGTGLSGSFRPCEFCGVDDASREVLRVFLASRGNMKELERHLGVSYPTARARFDDLLRALGLTPAGTLPPPAAPTPAPTPAPAPAPRAGAGATWAAATDDPTRPPPAPGADDPRLATLRAVAEGRLDLDAARSALGDAGG